MGKYRTPQTWHRIEELLDEVLELEGPKRRKAFLDSLTGTDALFRPRLEEILRSTPQADDLFEQPLLEPLVGDVKPGTRLGAYLIVRQRGIGGMGEVFEAERNDGVYQKRVAIKLLLTGSYRPDMTRRFETERQILADMVHPNIAQLHDGGTSGGGRPYLVMEYVDGRRIDRYCDEESLSIEERLRIFVQVCAAVTHAHRHAIVHRDIKPSNILVDNEGTPKLLDFGIAKMLDHPGATRGQQPRTPEYAAPEQIDSRAVTTSLDVFALGAVLFELVTGHRFRPDTTSPPADSTDKPSMVVQRTVEGGDGAITPESVSKPRSVSPGKLRSLLSGDLDCIVLRAVSGKPEDRYSSVDEMSEDIERHLEGRPIQARGDEIWYRAWRYAGYYRHQVAIAALCLVLVALGSIGYLQYQRTILRQQQDLAVSRAAIDVFQLSEPVAPGQSVSAQILLENALSNLETDQAPSPALGLIGSFFVGIGEYEHAAPLLRRALQDLDPEHPLQIYFQTDLNLVEYLMFHSGSARQGSVSTSDLALQLPPSPADESFSNFLNNRAVGLYQRGEYPASIVLYLEALTVAEEEGSVDALSIETIQQNLATSYERAGRRDEAIRLLRTILRSRQDRFGLGSEETIAPLQMLSVALQSSMSKHELQEAEALAQEALGIEHSAMNLATLATATRMFLYLESLSDLERATRLEKAQMLFRQAEANSAGEPRGTAVCQLGLSILAQEETRFAEAETLAREALNALGEFYGPDHWRLADGQSVLGGALSGQGDIATAAPLLERSYDILVNSRGEHARPTLEAKHRLKMLEESLPQP